MKPGEQFELDGWDYASQYEDNKFDSPQIVFGGGDVADISEDPFPGKCKVLAKKPGSTNVVVRFDSADARLWVIYKITVSPHKITLTPNSKSETYDGTEKSVSGFETLEFVVEGTYHIGDKVVVNPTFCVSGVKASASGVAAGEYPIEVTGTPIVTVNGVDVTDRCKISYAEAKLVIGQRPITLASASDAREYNGKPLTNHEVAVGEAAEDTGWVDGQGATYSFTGSQKIVGSSENTFECIPNEGTNLDNYKITKQYGTLSVTNRSEKYQITLTPNSKSEAYDGTEKSVSGFEVLEFEVDGSTYTVEGLTAEARGTDAGEYPVEVSGQAVVIDSDGNDVTSQFAVGINDAKLTIVKDGSDEPASGDSHTGDSAALYLMGICAVVLTVGAVALFTFRKRNNYK